MPPVEQPPEIETVPVALGERSYEIAITNAGLGAFVPTLHTWLTRRGSRPDGRLAVVVTDDHVRDRYAVPVTEALRQAGWKCEIVALPPGEQTKSHEFVSQLYDRLVEFKADRQTVIVAVGGGVIGDLAGFVAATYARGLPFVQVPTTLLAQVDSSVGGKVGINHPRGKNLIGAFHQPLGVFIDTSLLETLPIRDYRSGLAEVIKYGVILDEAFFAYLEQNVAALNQRSPVVMRQIVARSCQLKAQVVEQDEYERSGLRAVLNYGHTFAHAFETLCGYGALLHGEAVAIGMVYASRLAEGLGRTDAVTTARQVAILRAVGLPVELPQSSRPAAEAILDAMRLDKKSAAGQLRFILPTKLGHVELVPVAEPDVRAALENAD
ncbi:MAG: 3-dehydroquinate synthase [Planctomycetaceae bacterium]|nr:3-dehydroquinate synthase [Planctomycetaceae bacterium]